ncbi:hypothetical protein B0H19DRAFT_1068215 [Mycena capillaripes]|nr:hypothetical protein B0H19DRAFT_1068215 [Mycena capillaripes]
MTDSLTSAISSSLFIKQRRAHVACTKCRQRKVKCVKVAETSYTSCTRCTQKGIKCEYFPVAEDYAFSPPSTPSSNIVASRERIYSYVGWPPGAITLPSAGITPHVGPIRSHSESARRHSIPTSGSSINYPYEPRPASASAMLPNATSRVERLYPPRSSSADSNSYNVLDFVYPFRRCTSGPNQPAPTAPLYHPVDTPYFASPHAGHLEDSFVDHSYAEDYVSHVPRSGIVCSWPENIFQLSMIPITTLSIHPPQRLPHSVSFPSKYSTAMHIMGGILYWRGPQLAVQIG